MTDEEFDAFVAAASEALGVKQAALERRYGLGRRAQWDFDAKTGVLRFLDISGAAQVEAQVTPIGSYSTETQTFRWAWSAPATAGVAGRAAQLRDLFDVTGIEVFREETFEADEQMAWELTAMAVAHLSAAGAYRVVSRPLFLFLAIDEIRSLSKPN